MLVLAETPSNPLLELADLDELGSIKGPFTVVDSTFATPLGQQPLAHGVDISLHSATKGIAGHNDATLGVISGDADLLGEIWAYSVLHGATPSPFDALNALRGLRTMGVRTRQQNDTARSLAITLADHPEVRRRALSRPQRAPAARRSPPSSSASTAPCCRSRSPIATPRRRCSNGCEIARVATSLGGPETIVCHPSTSTHASLTPDEKAAAGVSEGLLRVSIGLEDDRRHRGRLRTGARDARLRTRPTATRRSATARARS